jgi:type VI secretion system secreted protein VgrG
MARSIRSSLTARSAATIGLAAVLALSFGSAAHADVIIDGPVNLGRAGSFGVLGDETVTNTGDTVVNGDVGLSPGTSVTGFTEGPGVIVDGELYINVEEAEDAQTDAEAAFLIAASLTPQESNITQLDGRELTPGVYSGDAINLAENGDLAFDGSASSVWVIQVASSLTIGSSTDMTFSGGASGCNVFWQVGESATIGTAADFAGTVIASESVTANTEAVIDGRLLALNAAVTLDTNLITVPEPCVTGTVIETTTPEITSDAPDDGTVGTEYEFDVEASGTPESSFTVVEGALPPGLTLDSDTGVISGTPTTPGSYDVTIEADNGDSVTDSADYTIDIVAAAVVPSPSPSPTDGPSPSPLPSDSGDGGGSGDGGSGTSGGSGEPLAVTGSESTIPIVAGTLALLMGIALTASAARARRASRPSPTP